MSTLLAQLSALSPTLYTPLHPYCPFGPVDIYGAIRLSQIIDWIATGAYEYASEQDAAVTAEAMRKVRRKMVRERASLMQECFGLMVVLFGGETFLSICTRSTPSWLLSPKIGLLFGVIREFFTAITQLKSDALQTRTPLRRVIPERPTLALELVLAIPDAIGRTLLLTKFSILPLLRTPSSGATQIPPTPASLILVPFILASPFAALAFSGMNAFLPRLHPSPPFELRPGGWLMVDAWLPLVLPAMFCTLIGPIPGWSRGLGWSEEESIMACFAFVLVAFVGRSLYNFGYRADHWSRMLEKRPVRGKIKKA